MDNRIVGEAFPGSGDTGSMNPHKCLFLCVKTALKITHPARQTDTLPGIQRGNQNGRQINQLSQFTNLKPCKSGKCWYKKIVQDIQYMNYHI